MNEALLLSVLLAAAPAGEVPVRTLTVRQAVELALARAPEVAVARAVAEEARAAAGEAASPRKPQFFLNTTPGYSTGVPLSVAGEVPAFVGARLRMTFWDPSERGEELEAQARAAAFEAALEDVRSEIARRAASACAKLAADEARAVSARRLLAAWQEILRRERALAVEGRRTELDVARMALEEARARQKLYAAESDRDLDRHELAMLTGLPVGTPLAVVGDPLEAVAEPEPGDTSALALSRDRQLSALSRQAEALGRSARLLSRTFKPSVNAEARYAYVPDAFGYDKYYLNFEENVASVGVSVVLPVFTGGRDKARAARSRARLEQVEAERRLRESEVSRLAREVEAQLARAGIEAGLARRSVAIAEEGNSQAKALAREGRGEADGPDRAEIALAQAEEQQAQSRRDLVESRLRLLALRGELLEAFGAEPVPAAEP